MSGSAPGLAISSRACTLLSSSVWRCSASGRASARRLAPAVTAASIRSMVATSARIMNDAIPCASPRSFFANRAWPARCSFSRATSGAAWATLASTRASNRDHGIRPSADSATAASTYAACSTLRSRVFAVTWRA